MALLAVALLWGRGAEGGVRAAETRSWASIPSGHLFLMEDPGHPALQAFRRNENFEADLPPPGGDEFERLPALAAWTARQFESSTPFPNYPPWDAAGILARIRAGDTGGFCAQYAVVFGQAAQSLGFAVRYVDLQSRDGMATHFTTEVFLDSRRGWALFEPQYGFSYVDGDGEPLGVLALHDHETGRREGAVMKYPSLDRVTSERLSFFYRFRIHLRNNFLSAPVYYRVRRVPEGLQWLFEPYRLTWTGIMGDDYIPGRLESRRREDFDFPVDMKNTVRIGARTAAGVLEHFGRVSDGAIYRLELEAGELDRLVGGHLVDDAAFRPLREEPSFDEVP